MNHPFDGEIDDPIRVDDYDIEMSHFDNTSVVDNTAQGINLQAEILNPTVNDFYERIDTSYKPFIDYSKFKIDERTGRLRLKSHPGVELVYVRGDKAGKPLPLRYLQSKLGIEAIRQELGFVDYVTPLTRVKLPDITQKRLQSTVSQLSEAETSFTTNPVQASNESVDAVDRAIQTINDPPLNTDGIEYTIRELRGLDQAMRTQRGELVNNLAKLTHLDNHIEMEKRKLTETNIPEMTERIRNRLSNLEEERSARLEAASRNKRILRSQIQRIRQTIHTILNEDTTLADRLRTLFREQGITIASILTAVGLMVSTLVLSITGGSPQGSGAPAVAPEGGTTNRFKDWLQSVARTLSKLASKAAAAIPGIIGSIISWLLNFLSKTASWLSQNIWALVVSVGGILILAVKNYVSKK